MNDAGFHDELDHLVRDSYMPDDKKASAICKLIDRHFAPKDIDGDQWCARCVAVEDVSRRMLEVMFAWAIGLCENKGVDPTPEEYVIQVFEGFRQELEGLGVPGVPEKRFKEEVA